MRAFSKTLFTAALVAVVQFPAQHGAPSVYSAMDPDEGTQAQIDSPARVEPEAVPMAVPVAVNRKPAVEPRVYLESADSKTGYVYYDYADQTPTQKQHPPARR